MPTNPTTPNANASVDRLALGIDAARGTEPSFPVPVGALCFEADASAVFPCGVCFEAETSGIPPCSIAANCLCFDVE